MLLLFDLVVDFRKDMFNFYNPILSLPVVLPLVWARLPIALCYLPANVLIQTLNNTE